MKNVKMISLYISPELIRLVEEYQHEHWFKNRNKAIVKLIEKGLWVSNKMTKKKDTD